MLIGQWRHCSCSAFVGGGGIEGGEWGGGFIGVQQEETVVFYSLPIMFDF